MSGQAHLKGFTVVKQTFYFGCHLIISTSLRGGLPRSLCPDCKQFRALAFVGSSAKLFWATTLCAHPAIYQMNTRLWSWVCNHAATCSHSDVKVPSQVCNHTVTRYLSSRVVSHSDAEHQSYLSVQNGLNTFLSNNLVCASCNFPIEYQDLKLGMKSRRNLQSLWCWSSKSGMKSRRD